MEIERNAITFWKCKTFIRENVIRYEECIRDCEAALNLNSKYVKGYGRLAKSYMALGNYQRAIEAFEKAIECAPADLDLQKEQKTCKLVNCGSDFCSSQKKRRTLKKPLRRKNMQMLQNTSKYY
jgi:tetratricopeptide (TPR) repeat protein